MTGAKGRMAIILVFLFLYIPFLTTNGFKLAGKQNIDLSSPHKRPADEDSTALPWLILPVLMKPYGTILLWLDFLPRLWQTKPAEKVRLAVQG